MRGFAPEVRDVLREGCPGVAGLRFVLRRRRSVVAVFRVDASLRRAVLRGKRLEISGRRSDVRGERSVVSGERSDLTGYEAKSADVAAFSAWNALTSRDNEPSFPDLEAATADDALKSADGTPTSRERTLSSPLFDTKPAGVATISLEKGLDSEAAAHPLWKMNYPHPVPKLRITIPRSSKWGGVEVSIGPL
jgi:hypothetical protein